MAHTFEPATSNRAKCRGCGERIATGDLRFGERLPNPFADGEMTHWFHLECAAFKRPHPFLETLEKAAEPVPDSARLAALARAGIEHPHLPRVNGAERASSGRAVCRSCSKPIDKGALRFTLVFYEEGRFVPSGFLHVPCATAYFGTTDVLDRVRRFAPKLSDEDLSALQAELQAAPPPGLPPTK